MPMSSSSIADPAIDLENTPEVKPSVSAEKSPGKKPGLYQVVWRWHFYAGLLVAPILLLVTVTGAIYVFRTELTEWRDHSLLYVEPQGERTSYEQLKAVAEQAAQPHEIEAVVLNPEENRSVRFVADAAEEHEDGHDHAHQHLHIYVNPYTAEVLGERIAEQDFFAVVLQLHRNLMLGTTGRYVTELVTSWGLVLMATGLYLWWPRGKKNAGVWLPRLKGKLYPVLRDWHAVSGFYLLPFAVLILATGMFFTVIWGGTFNKSVQAAGQWPEAWFGDQESIPPSENAQAASLDAVVATVLQYARPHDTVTIFPADGPDVAHKAWYIQDEDKNSYNMVAVDQYTAAKVASMSSNEVPPLYKLRLLTVSIHMGQIFGLPTKILALLTSIGLMALSVTGLWMWWKRRPNGRTGFPRRPAMAAFPLWGWLVVVAFGILLPVAGVSFLLVGMLDWLWSIRRNRVAAA